MTIVSNTTPLRYLVVVEAIQALPALYGRVMIPEAVLEELRHPSAPAAVRDWASRLPEWLKVRTVSFEDPTLDLGLGDRDRGERAAILLALEQGVNMVLLDDLKARRAAMARGLRVTGTLGVLEAANMQTGVPFGVKVSSVLKISALNYSYE